MTGWPRTLAWTDFTAIANPGPTQLIARNGHPIVARVNVSIMMYPANSGRATDGCSFTNLDVRVVTNSLEYVPSRIPAGEEAYYLRHEQGHMDLMGLFAREIEVALFALHAASPVELDQLARAAVDHGVVNARTYAINTPALDCIYDRETNHGMNRPQQAHWNDQIGRNVLRWRDPGFRFLFNQ